MAFLLLTPQGFQLVSNIDQAPAPNFTPDNNQAVVQRAGDLERDLHKAIKQADSAHKISSSQTRFNNLCKLYLDLIKIQSPNVRQSKFDNLAASMADLYREDFRTINDLFLKKFTARKRTEKPELAKLLIHIASFSPLILGLKLGEPTLINKYIKEEIKRNPNPDFVLSALDSALPAIQSLPPLRLAINDVLELLDPTDDTNSFRLLEKYLKEELDREKTNLPQQLEATGMINTTRIKLLSACLMLTYQSRPKFTTKEDIKLLFNQIARPADLPFLDIITAESFESFEREQARVQTRTIDSDGFRPPEKLKDQFIASLFYDQSIFAHLSNWLTQLVNESTSPVSKEEVVNMFADVVNEPINQFSYRKRGIALVMLNKLYGEDFQRKLLNIVRANNDPELIYIAIELIKDPTQVISIIKDQIQTSDNAIALALALIISTNQQGSSVSQDLKKGLTNLFVSDDIDLTSAVQGLNEVQLYQKHNPLFYDREIPGFGYFFSLMQRNYGLGIRSTLTNNFMTALIKSPGLLRQLREPSMGDPYPELVGWLDSVLRQGRSSRSKKSD